MSRIVIRFVIVVLFGMLCSTNGFCSLLSTVPIHEMYNSDTQKEDGKAFGFDFRGIYSIQDESKDYVVFSMPDISASQIKASLYSKLSSMYSSPKDAITNVSDNIIQLEGYASRVYLAKKSTSIYPVDIAFSIIIQIKDGKIRYNIPTIKQIYIQNVPVLGTASLDMTKPLRQLISEDEDREAVASYFNKLIQVLNSSISEEDDW